MKIGKQIEIVEYPELPKVIPVEIPKKPVKAPKEEPVKVPVKVDNAQSR